MIAWPVNTRIWIAAGVTDLRRGFTGLPGSLALAAHERKRQVLCSTVGIGSLDYVETGGSNEKSLARMLIVPPGTHMLILKCRNSSNPRCLE